MKAYSQDLRDRVIRTYLKGKHTKTELAALFQMCRGTVREWIKRYETDGDYRSKQADRSGPSCRFTDKEAVITYLSAHPDASGIEMRDHLFPGCPMSTWYDTLKRLGITYKKRAKIQAA